MEWMPISEAPPENTLGIVFSANRTFTDARTGKVAEPMGNGRDAGCQMDIAVYLHGRWCEVYTGHDCNEEWRGDDVPTHWMPLPAPPQGDE